ncbi:MAG: DAK2 domain-containing protein [Candidatus Flexifilum sp.]
MAMITRQAFRANNNLMVDGFLIKTLFGAGLTWLEKNKERVNRLNVFPVPDGDTGTNMFLTLRNAYREIADLQEDHVGRLSSAIARGALTGARGNSGVILSQLFAGVAAALKDQEKLTAESLVRACQYAVDYAYKAVEKPVEGTILTVARAMKESVEARAQRDQDLVVLLKRMVSAGRTTLRHPPDLLPKLKEAGVVDSGGAGLVFIFEGMLRALCGKPMEVADLAVDSGVHAPAAVVHEVESWEDALVPEDELGYGYDVQFLMRGDNLRIDEVRTAIQNMGWSTLVVGDDQLIKVHVHVHDPGQPLSYAIGLGASLDDIVVENMQAQYETYVQRRASEETDDGINVNIPGVAVIVVASGKGLHKLFKEQFHAAYVISGGQTMNPSTGDFIDVINALPNDEIILLPNNKNVLLAAQQAANSAESAGKRVRVVHSFSIPQGIAAMFEYINMDGPGGSAAVDALVDAMSYALPNVITCEITNATRDAEFGGIQVRAGQFIGLIDDELAASSSSVEEVTLETLRKAQAHDYERITLYFGRDVKRAAAEALADMLRQHFSAQEVEVYDGGQMLYPYIIGIE